MHNGMLVHLIMRASFRDTSHPVGPLFSTVHLRLRCLRGDRQSLACILYSYYTSFSMPESGMHIVQLSHFILHTCFSSTSQPLRALFSPQPRLT